MKNSSKIAEISWKTCYKKNMLKSHQMYQMLTNGTSHIMECITQLSQVYKGWCLIVSAEYLGYALNKLLIPGPGLTNQIVKVLVRFREEHVDFLGQIEVTFYQVGIPKCEQTML